MFIEQARLRNLCQFRDRTFTFTKGLNLVCGPNGYGKSNLVKSLYAAITNDWSRNAGGKDANVNQLSGGGYSAAEVTLRHDDVTAVVTRGLGSRSKHTLQLGDGPLITGEAEVNRRLQALLGASDWVMSELLFVDQGKTSAFLLDTDAKRTKNLQALFGLAWVETLAKWLGEESRHLGYMTQAPDIADMKLRLAEAQALLAALGAREATLLAERPEGDSASDQRLLQRLERADAQRAELGRLESQRASRGSQSSALSAEILELDRQLKVLRGKSLTEKPAAEEAREALGRLELERRNAQTRAQAREAIDRCETARLANRKPELSGVERGAELDLDAELESLSVECDRRRRFLAMYDPARGDCPECGAPAAHLTTRHERFMREMVDLDARQRMLTVHRTALRAWQSREASLERSLAAERARLIAAGPASDASALSEDSLRALIATHEATTSATLKIDLRLSRCRAELAALRGAEAEATRNEVALRRALAEAEGLPSRELLLARLARRGELDQGLAAVRAESAVASREALRLRGEIAAGQDKWVQAAAYRDWMSHCQELRAYVAYDQLPQALLRSCLARLEPEIHRNLDMFDARFTVEVRDDLAFDVIKIDGVRHRESRLSGAELLMLALSVRLALTKLFTAGLGFLCLDEPTYGLDADHRRALAGVLDKLRDYSLAAEAQVLLVTHDVDLARKYDNKVDLGEPES